MPSKSPILQPRRARCHLRIPRKTILHLWQLNSGRLNLKTLLICPSSMSQVLHKIHCRLSTQKPNMRVESSTSSLCFQLLVSEPSAVLMVFPAVLPVALKSPSRGRQHRPERIESIWRCGPQTSSVVVCPARAPQQARGLQRGQDVGEYAETEAPHLQSP